MSAQWANREGLLTDPAAYARRRPEQTLLYQLVERHYPQFVETFAARRYGHARADVCNPACERTIKIRSAEPLGQVGGDP